MLPLDDAIDVAEAGGKARALARARRAGLPVLDGVVVLPSEIVDEATLAEALRRLGGARFAVRSSASVEDGERASAAGVFRSEIGVRAGDVAAAIARVRRSATDEPARAYLAAHRLSPSVTMAVLVQPLAAAQRLGVLHSEPRDAGGGFPVEERLPDEPEWGACQARLVDPRADPLGALATQAVALLGGPTDLEYALVDGVAWLLQLRPLTVRPAAPWPMGALPGAGRWQLDAEHNPAPLSAAQSSLVALLDGKPGLPRLKVCGGYLYVRTDPTAAATAPLLEVASLSQHLAATGAILAPLESARDPPPPAAALTAYATVAQRHFAELSPSLAAARRALDRLLVAHLGERLTDHAALLGGCGGLTVARDQALWRLGQARGDDERRPLLADYLARFGATAPSWDVLAPPDDEAIDRVLATAALVARGASPAVSQARATALAVEHAAHLAARLAPAARRDLELLLPDARAAAALAEDDDQLFFRAQRLVRRSLLATATATATVEDRSLIFELPIGDPYDRDAALAARAARHAAGALVPPRVVSDGQASWDGDPGEVLRGAGTPGRARGRVRRIIAGEAGEDEAVAGAILVVAAILPSLSYLLPTAAALVTDHGGALSHGATLAREYGLPAVLGTGAATRLLRDGDEVFVDGDAGRVYRLGDPTSSSSS